MRLTLTYADIANIFATAGGVKVAATATSQAAGQFRFTDADFDIEEHASDIIPKLAAMGAAKGVIRRDWTAVEVGGTAEVGIDLDVSGVTGGTVEAHGGTVDLRRGDFSTLTMYGGVLDTTRLRAQSNVTTLNLYPGVIWRKKKYGPQLVAGTDNSPSGGATVIEV